MNETPTLLEELNRKTFETLEKLETDRIDGKITRAQFGYGVDIIWSAVAGLVDSEFVTAVEMMNEHRRPVETKLVFWHEESGLIARIINDHLGKLTYTMFKPGGNASNHVLDYKEEARPQDHTKKKVRDLVTALTKRGFVLI